MDGASHIMMDGASHDVMREYEVRLGAPERREGPPAAAFRSDTAFAFNVTLSNVRVTRVQQLSGQVRLQLSASARSMGSMSHRPHAMSRGGPRSSPTAELLMWGPLQSLCMGVSIGDT